MPQLIAMIIVVVGAMIYMFQTFGGAGDKIEGIAQKTSVITEINNIKAGVQLALKSGDLTAGKTLKDLADLEYFDKQINEQIKANADTTNNTYNAISFGGDASNAGGMTITLVNAGTTGNHAGLKVDFPSTGKLGKNGGFLESQLGTDLKGIAVVDKSATANEAAIYDTTNKKFKTLTSPTDGKEKDGSLVIYYRDLPPVE